MGGIKANIVSCAREITIHGFPLLLVIITVHPVHDA